MNELYRDFMDRKLSSIDGHLIDIINGIHPGPGDDKPIFTKTVLADNTALSNTFTLSDSVSNYDLIEFITLDNTDNYYNRFIMTAGCINDILNLNTINKLICFNTLNTNRYVAYTVSGNVYTRYNYRVLNVVQVNGYKCTNKTVVEDVLFSTTTKSDSYINIPITEDIYDYDMVLIGYNDTDDDEIGPINNIFYPNDTLGKNVYLTNNFYNNPYNTFIESNMIYNIRPVYVRGIKYE